MPRDTHRQNTNSLSDIFTSSPTVRGGRSTTTHAEDAKTQDRKNTGLKQDRQNKKISHRHLLLRRIKADRRRAHDLK